MHQLREIVNRLAKCCCGNCTIEVTGEPEMHGVCHCSNCKKRTGSAFGISSYFKNESLLNKVGDFSCYALHNTEQNHDQERYFCSRCGTTLFWTVSTWPEVTGIAGGCFVGNDLDNPDGSYNHTQKCEWLTLPNSWSKNV